MQYGARELAETFLVAISTGIFASLFTVTMLQIKNKQHKIGFSYILIAAALSTYSILYLIVSRGFVGHLVKKVADNIGWRLFLLLWIVIILILFIVGFYKIKKHKREKMKKIIFLFFILIGMLLISGCVTKYQCADGSFVDSIDLCSEHKCTVCPKKICEKVKEPYVEKQSMSIHLIMVLLAILPQEILKKEL